jgi:hypothetical protein
MHVEVISTVIMPLWSNHMYTLIVYMFEGWYVPPSISLSLSLSHARAGEAKFYIKDVR